MSEANEPQTTADTITDQQALFKYLLDGLDAQLADDITEMVRGFQAASVTSDKPLTVDGVLGTLAMALALHLSWLDNDDEVVLSKCVHLSQFVFAQVIVSRSIQHAAAEARNASHH